MSVTCDGRSWIQKRKIEKTVHSLTYAIRLLEVVLFQWSKAMLWQKTIANECQSRRRKKAIERCSNVTFQLSTHRVPCATGHLWLPSVFFVEKKRPQCSQENSQILPCFATSCRSRSCCRENFSEQPKVQGNVTRGLGLCASICTFRVYWLVKRLVQPRIRQGYRLRGLFWSQSLWFGDDSRERPGRNLNFSGLTGDWAGEGREWWTNALESNVCVCWRAGASDHCE